MFKVLITTMISELSDSNLDEIAGQKIEMFNFLDLEILASFL